MELDTITCMDALAFARTLPNNSVDIVITSPPYNIHRKSRPGGGLFRDRKAGFLNNNGPRYANYNDEMPEDEYQVWLADVVRECLRISKGLVWINHKLRFRNGVGIHPLQFLRFPLWSEIIWNRGGSIMFNAKRFAQSHEYVFGFGHPHFWDNALNVYLSVWDIPTGSSNHDNDHPCPFPSALVRPLILASCPPSGIVFDPFSGSGTTLIAANQYGRHYLGCDISPEYVALARERIAQADPYQPKAYDDGVTQLSLFAQEDD